MSEWLVDFRGQNRSGLLNFLWRRGSVYVMDNHRVALWCWLQHIDPRTPHSLFHIDQHYDTLQSELEREYLPAWDIGLNEYLNHRYRIEGGPCSELINLFRWDNYLAIYFDTFGESIKDACFATHGKGQEPNFQIREFQPWQLPEDLDYELSPECAPWIVNIDLDYFFWRASDPSENAAGQMFSTEYIRRLSSALRRRIADGTVAVTTICLTPGNFTGGWPPAEQLMEDFLGGIGISFKLPP
jgi:hypothetical protein